MFILKPSIAPLRGVIAILLSLAPIFALAEADLRKVETSIRDSTNDFRATKGIAALEAAPALEKAARKFAQFMARTDKYGHAADGRTPSERAEAAGYDYCLVAENIASQFHSDGFETPALAEAFFSGWKKSQGHRENMLEAAATETGVALARSKTSGTYYAVQLVGRPLSAMISVTIANLSSTTVRYQIDDEKARLAPGNVRQLGRCRPPEIVVFALGENADAKQSFSPMDGDRIVVRGGDAAVLSATLKTPESEE